jgi:hypothetical protein
MKWLAAGAAIVVVVLVVLLREVLSDDDAPPADRRVAATGDGGTKVVRPPSAVDAAVLIDAPGTVGLEPLTIEEPDAATGVFAPRTAEFFERVDEYSTRRLPEFVADCDTAGEDRKAKLKVRYRVVIQNHVVTFRDVTVEESTLKNERTKDCMVHAITNAEITDSNMPDFESKPGETEFTLIRVEKLDKRFR